ncbi:hypothetical protein BVY03_02615 [bacterium K02(2017)]|nr:hypothetical protein BVY03_02615 [bacterium K02(2017)]
MARWITGIILAIAAVFLLLYAPPTYLKILVCALSLIGAWEFFSITIPERLSVKIIGLILVGFGLSIVIYCQEAKALLFFIYVVMFLSFCIQFPGPVATPEKMRQTAFFVLGLFYCCFLFGILALMTDLPQYKYFLFLTLACTHGADTGAYVVGKNFGKNKLAPLLSPGKTREGGYGSVLGSILGAILVTVLFQVTVNWWLVLGIGAALGVIGLLGDLAESLLKRGFGVKDSGKLIPGHGGILDRFDSLLFTSPFVYFVAPYFQF